MGNRLIIVILFHICISVNLNAKDYFATLIENFDVDDVTMTQDNTHPVAFWNSLVQNSMNVEELLMNMGKKRGAEREALEVLGTLPRYDKEFRPKFKVGMTFTIQNEDSGLLVLGKINGIIFDVIWWKYTLTFSEDISINNSWPQRDHVLTEKQISEIISRKILCSDYHCVY